jgi:hypothetical protein
VCGAAGSPTTKHWFRSALFISIEQNPVQLSLFCTLLVARLVADEKNASRRIRKIAKNDHYFRHVCPSVYMKQLASHWTDFHANFFLEFSENPF